MRQFLIYSVSIIALLLAIYFFKDENQSGIEKNNLKVYASASFISDWGPGPDLVKAFEKKTGIKILFKEMSDPGLTLQKMNMSEDFEQVDVLLGLNQYDVVRFFDKIKWKNISKYKSYSQITPALASAFLENDVYKKSLTYPYFIPYDWSAISFVARKDAKILLSELNDLNRSELKSKIAYEDPRTSSPGLQFLMWVSQSFSETQAISFLKKIESDSHSISPSWSAAYGLFKNRNVDYVLSYITSPIYHLVEENDPNYIAFDFKEGLPLQIEFVGVADKCMSCEAAYQFVTYLQSAEAQSLIMKKNYMLPIEKNIVESTAFDTLTKYNFLPYKPITKDEINKWLRIWSEIKKNDI